LVSSWPSWLLNKPPTWAFLLRVHSNLTTTDIRLTFRPHTHSLTLIERWGVSMGNIGQIRWEGRLENRNKNCLFWYDDCLCCVRICLTCINIEYFVEIITSNLLEYSCCCLEGKVLLNGSVINKVFLCLYKLVNRMDCTTGKTSV